MPLRSFLSVLAFTASGVASAQSPTPVPGGDSSFIPNNRAVPSGWGSTTGVARVGGQSPTSDILKVSGSDSALPPVPKTPESQKITPACPPVVLPPCEPTNATSMTTLSLEKPAVRPNLSWVTGEYLFSFIKPGNIPFALGSTGPAAGLGILGKPGTTGLFGPQNVDYGTFAGLRIGAGRWLSDSKSFGVEGSAFLLENRSVINSVSDLPVLSRPFFDTNTVTENARVLTAPGAFSGSMFTSSSSRVWGGDVGGILRMWESKSGWNVDAVAGFKFLSLEESLLVSDTSQVLPIGGVTAFDGVGYAAPARTGVNDYFSTQNRFYGAGLGTRLTWDSDRWFGGLTGKVSLGTIHRTVNIDGSSTLNGLSSATTSMPGGLLALNTNMGRVTDNGFSVLPEVSANIGYRVTSRFSIAIGYQFLYLTNVVRPGDQLSRNLNPTRIPTDINYGVPFGPAQPAAQFATQDFWMHGATVGLQLGF